MPAPKAATALALTLVLAAWTCQAGRVHAQDADPDKLRAVQSELEEARRRKAEAEAEKNRLAAEVARLKDQLVQRAAAIRAREAEADTLERRMAELSASEAEKLAALGERRAALSRLLGALTRLSRRPPVLLMVRRQSALDIAHTGIVLRDMVPELRSRATALAHDLSTLATLRARLATDRNKLDTTLAALATERSEMDRLLAQKAADGKRLEAQAASEGKRVEQLAAKAKSIEDLIAAVERERREQEAREAAARAKADAAEAESLEAARPPGQQAVATAEPTTPAAPARPPVMAKFASLKGKLAWPAAGEIVSRFGDRQANGLTSRGFRVRTRPSAQVTAPAAGDVAFAGPFTGYGQLLILSQGDGYHLLLAGLERIDVTVGQKVLAGEPVGQMAGAVEGARPVLYVELRHNGEPVDLTPWLASGATKVSG